MTEWLNWTDTTTGQVLKKKVDNLVAVPGQMHTNHRGSREHDKSPRVYPLTELGEAWNLHFSKLLQVILLRSQV